MKPESTTNKEITLNEYPAGNSSIQNRTFLALIILEAIIMTVLIYTDTIEKKEIYSWIVSLFGMVIFITGLFLSAFYTNRYKKPQGGFGLFWWIGGFITVWGVLIHFMQKV